MNGDVVRFGPFCFDVAHRKLTRDGAEVRLGSRAAEILRALALAKGEVVTKGALMASVWPGQIVDENGIQVHVSALRKALGDVRGDRPPFIVTVPGRGYRFVAPQSAAREATAASETVSVSDRPAIAVLPFDNMSGDPQQSYFADGITEDLITALAHSKWFFVIARNSSFTYKGRAVDVRQIGRELGVRFVLEGSVRKGGDRLRITGQLIEAESGRHLWAEKFDCRLADVFDLQDRITEHVAAAIEPNLRASELRRSLRKPPTSLVAYDYVLQASSALGPSASREKMVDVISKLRKAIELDPDYMHAQALLARAHWRAKALNWSTPESEAEGLRCAERVIASGTNDPESLALAGFGLAYLDKRVEEAHAVTERAYAILPDSLVVAHISGWANLCIGDHAAALERFQRANRLNPIDSMVEMGGHVGLSYSLFALGRCEEGAAAARRGLAASVWGPGLRVLIINLVDLGRLSEAREAMARLLEISPNLTRRSLPTDLRFPPAFLERVVANLSAAGLPE